MPFALAVVALMIATGHAISLSAASASSALWQQGFAAQIPGFNTRWNIPTSSPIYKVFFGRWALAWSPVRVLSYGYTSSDGKHYWQVQMPDGKKSLALDTDLTPRPTQRGLNAAA